MNREILEQLNADTAEKRIANLCALLDKETEKPQVLQQYANNHIHTFYSFSPYSPTAAVWFARAAGLPTAGIMDHDSIAGAREFREAGMIAGIGTTCGFEARISFKGTPLENRKTNNPDQVGVSYMTFHSVRHEHFDRVQQHLAPLRERRNERGRLMTKKAAEVSGIELDFDRDVLPISNFHEGGGVTERHILFALACKMLPQGSSDERYALLGKLKSGMIKDIFIPAEAELMTLEEAVAFAKEIGAILCYAYLGDVDASPTGDKAAAKYEDEYLDELFELLDRWGVGAVTYMPSRNTAAQLERLMRLCKEHGMYQISGEDINSPSQSFICEQLAEPRFSHLVDAAWELVRREQ